MSEKYVIVGCAPRSGSLWICKVLNELGIKVGHEELGADGVVGWQYLVNHPWVMKALKVIKDRPVVWLHQSRHPVPTIKSIAAMYKRGDWPPLTPELPLNYVFKITKSDSTLVKALKLYYYTNLSGLQNQKFRQYRVESIDASWPWISELIGFPNIPLPKVPRDTNSHKDLGMYEKVTWADIFDAWPSYAMNVARLADKMGYVVNKAYLAEPDEDEKSSGGQMDMFKQTGKRIELANGSSIALADKPIDEDKRLKSISPDGMPEL